MATSASAPSAADLWGGNFDDYVRYLNQQNQQPDQTPTTGAAYKQKREQIDPYADEPLGGGQTGGLKVKSSAVSGLQNAMAPAMPPVSGAGGGGAGTPAAAPPINIADAFGGEASLAPLPNFNIPQGPEGGPTAGFVQRPGKGAINTQLGQRVFPNEISALRALTY